MITNEISEQLTLLKNNLSQLDTARNNILKSSEISNKVTVAVDSIVKKQAEYQTELKSDIANHMSVTNTAVKSSVDSSLAPLNELINSHKNTLLLFKKEVSKSIEEYERLITASQHLVDKIEGINFPNRLDKIDSAITSVNIGLQNSQTSISNIERKLEDVSSKQMSKLISINTWLIALVVLQIIGLVLLSLYVFKVIAV